MLPTPTPEVMDAFKNRHVTMPPHVDEGGTGHGIPSGGTRGQLLQKKTNTDYDVEWSDVPQELPEGGTIGQVLAKKTDASGDVEWVDQSGGSLPSGGTTGQVLTKTASGEEWADVPEEIPSGGTNGQVLTKTANGKEWADVPTELPSGGSTGQVLTKTAQGTAWQTPQGGGLPSGGTTGQMLVKTSNGSSWQSVGTVKRGILTVYGTEDHSSPDNFSITFGKMPNPDNAVLVNTEIDDLPYFLPYFKYYGQDYQGAMPFYVRVGSSMLEVHITSESYNNVSTGSNYVFFREWESYKLKIYKKTGDDRDPDEDELLGQFILDNEGKGSQLNVGGDIYQMDVNKANPSAEVDIYTKDFTISPIINFDDWDWYEGYRSDCYMVVERYLNFKLCEDSYPTDPTGSTPTITFSGTYQPNGSDTFDTHMEFYSIDMGPIYI